MLLLITLPLNAQIRNTTSNIVWGSTGYCNIMNNSNQVNAVGRAGTTFGIGLERNRYNFLIQTGIEFSYYSSKMTVDDSLHVVRKMEDSEGDIYDGYFLFEKNKDIQRFFNIGIPIMLGYEFRNNFYFLAGEKFLFNLAGKSYTSSQVSSYAYYSYLIGENNDGILKDLPSQGLETVDRKITKETQLNAIFVSSIEVGYTFENIKSNHRSYYKSGTIKYTKPSYRIALFLDYGIAPFNDTQTEDLIINTSDSDYNPSINHLLFYQHNSNRINTLYTGIKLTVLFDRKSKHDCNCYQ